MTAPTVVVDHYVPVGRPVRNFVVLVGVVIALLAALWWSALVTPRINWSADGPERFDPATGRGTTVVHIRNNGQLPIRVERVLVDGPQYRTINALASARGSVAPQPGPDASGFAAIDLAPGDTIRVETTFETTQCLPGPAIVKADVRTTSGLTRRVRQRGSIPFTPRGCRS